MDWAQDSRKAKGRDRSQPLLLSARFCRNCGLQRLNVRGLPALWSLHHVELHGLAFLQTLEPA